MKIRRMLIAMAAISLAAGAYALPPGEDPPPPPPPPPPELNDCSPGFWKNHQEYWASQYCGAQACVDDVMDNLTAKGKGSGDIRQAQADALNAWADDSVEGYGYLICAD